MSYPRYVQPVLDRYCGKCHQGDGEGRKTLDLTDRPGHLGFSEVSSRLPDATPADDVLLVVQEHGQGIGAEYDVGVHEDQVIRLCLERIGNAELPIHVQIRPALHGDV